MRTIFNIIYYSLCAAITALALLLVASFFPLDNWYQVKVVLSGSMEPELPTGSVIVIKPEAAYGLGDVITFGADTRESVPVTHRIVEVAGSERAPQYVTKGDANEDSDMGLVRPHEIIGKVWFMLPYVGYVLEFTKTSAGFVALVLVPGAIIMLSELWNIARAMGERGRSRRRGVVKVESV